MKGDEAAVIAQVEVMAVTTTAGETPWAAASGSIGALMDTDRLGFMPSCLVSGTIQTSAISSSGACTADRSRPEAATCGAANVALMVPMKPAIISSTISFR